MSSPVTGRGWKRTRSPCCPLFLSSKAHLPSPPLGLLHSLSLGRMSWEESLHPGLVLSALGMWTTGPQGDGGAMGPSWTYWPLSRRHHSHLPMGSLQPPGAARAGPVRHHLAPDLGRSQDPPLCCPPHPCSGSLRGGPPHPECPDRTGCLETLEGQQPQILRHQAPTTSLQDAHLGLARPCLTSGNIAHRPSPPVAEKPQQDLPGVSPTCCPPVLPVQK